MTQNYKLSDAIRELRVFAGNTAVVAHDDGTPDATGYGFVDDCNHADFGVPNYVVNNIAHADPAYPVKQNGFFDLIKGGRHVA